MLESTGGGNKEETLAKTSGYQVLIATDKCIRITPNIKIQV